MKVTSIVVLVASAVTPAVGCLEVGSDPAPSDEVMSMTLLARVEPTPNHVVSFYDSEFGIVITERGPIADAAQQLPLDRLRSAGMQAAYRALAGDDNAEIPARLLTAEANWLARHSNPPANAEQPVPPPAATGTLSTASGPGSVVAGGGGFGVVQSALGGLPTDAAWWQGLPLCQYKTYSLVDVIGWVDSVWCVTDATWAITGYRDTMYYESTGFGQGNAATVQINKWINGAWQAVVNTTVPYRWYQTFSFPPENGAYYQTFVTGTGGQNIGISERFRLAMPQPWFVNNKPSDVEYDFSNDLQGITHDVNYWYLTRTKYGCVSWLCDAFEPKYGLIAKVPLGTSLNNEPTGHGMPSSWNTMPGGGGRYNHFGDLVHVGGKLYVAMDGFAGGAVAIYDTNLTPLTYAPLSHNWSVPLVAYNEQDGLFYVPRSSTTFEKYQIIVWGGTNATATWKGTLQLSRSIPGPFQGAKFSHKGNLWLLTGSNNSNRQFYGIDGANGTVFITGTLNPGDADESEGLDIFDLDVETRPGMAGQLHLQMLNNQLDDDNWWLMHWRAPMDRL